MNSTFVRRLHSYLDQTVISALAYLPLLLTDPGRIAADTKAYLYLDPARLLTNASYMWQPDFGFGTVMHQNIGYLWPIGPFFTIGELSGLSDWVVQRLWLGSILLVAGLGVRWFLKTLSWVGPGVLVASLSYMLSPYILNYIDRHSVILLPWAALPWLLGLSERSLKTKSWYYPALFGLLTLTIGGVNASSLLFVGLGPFIWHIWAGLNRFSPWKRVISSITKIGIAFLTTGIWWIVGLGVQARFGLPILRLTENYKVVSDAATSPELFRGLGYWYFYGQGRLGPWVEPATSYTRWALPLSFALPLLGILFAALIRFRYRGHLIALFVLGMLVGIGSHPYENPSILGKIFREWTLTDTGLALRSTARAVPLVALSTAVFLGLGIRTLKQSKPGIAKISNLLLVFLIVVNMSPLWKGQLLGELVQRPEELPGYWHEVAQYLEKDSSTNRVLEIPGSDFAAYRWGNSGDPPLPGLIDRPYAARELIPLGTEASIALLIALDTEIQEGRLDPSSLAPLAHLLGIGDVVLRSDLQYERFRTPRPTDLWADLDDLKGFDTPVFFGENIKNVAGPERPLIDEHTLAQNGQSNDPFPATIFSVSEPTEILQTADPTRPILISGDAVGLVHAASEGLIEKNRPVFFSATLSNNSETIHELANERARLIVTDSNRKDGHRWGTIRETTGYTEHVAEKRAEDLSDYRIKVPGGGNEALTVAEQSGLQVTATAYGNPVTYTAGSRPFHAVDGSFSTAWTVGAFNKVKGERFVIELEKPEPIESIRLTQSNVEGQNRWITALRIHADGEILDLNLNERSRSKPGQLLDLALPVTSKIELEILETDLGELNYYAGISGVGFSEIKINEIAADETIRMPLDLINSLGEDSGAELFFLSSRQRSDPLDPIRSDPEEFIDRTFSVPWKRNFYITGEARLSPYASESLIDKMIWGSETLVTSTSYLPGDIHSRGRLAFDGMRDTSWQTGFDESVGASVTFNSLIPQLFENIKITHIADRYHSEPTSISIYSDKELLGSFNFSEIPSSSEETLVSTSLPLQPFSSDTLSIQIDSIKPKITMDWYSGLPSTLPIGIAEVEIEHLPTSVFSETFNSGCRSDLLSLNGNPISIRIFGKTKDALTGGPLKLENCDETLQILPGTHRLASEPGRSTGLSIDRLLLTSPSSGTLPKSSLPTIRILQQGHTDYKLSVENANEPFWLILGQSYNEGWKLTASDKNIQESPILINGFANGWLIDPSSSVSDFEINIDWTPQRWVWAALFISLLFAVGAICIFFRNRRSNNFFSEKPLSCQWQYPFQKLQLSDKPRFSQLFFSFFIAFFCAINLPSLIFVSLIIAVLYLLIEKNKLPQGILGLIGVASMGIAAAFIAIDQIRFRYPRDFVWPLFFEKYHVLGVIAVLLFAAQTILDLRTNRSTKTTKV